MPLYLIATCAVVLIKNIKGGGVSFGDFVSSIFFVPVLHDGLYVDPIVSLAWTLRFEMFFYLSVALGVLFSRILIVPFFVVIAAFSVWCFNGFYFGAPIVLEFLLGYLIGLAYVCNPDSGRGVNLVNCLGLCFSVVLMLLASLGRDFGYAVSGLYAQVPRMWIEYFGVDIPRVLIWGLPAGLLVYFVIRLENSFSWRASSFGQYTYSVYLLQVFVIPFCFLLRHYFGEVLTLLVFFSVLAASSYVSFHFFERPILNLKKYVLN